jgi:hypothetical protein
MPRSLSSPLREVEAEAAASYPAELLERLHRTARTDINRHININGRCAVCTVVFPCERAELAEMVLGLL